MMSLSTVGIKIDLVSSHLIANFACFLFCETVCLKWDYLSLKFSWGFHLIRFASWYSSVGKF